MVISAYILVVVCGERPVGDRDCVSLCGGKFFHRLERGLELFLRHPWIVDGLKEVTRSRAEARTKSRTRRPVAWSLWVQHYAVSGDPGGVSRG